MTTLSLRQKRLLIAQTRWWVLRLLLLWPFVAVLALIPPPPKFRRFKGEAPIEIRNGFYVALLASIICGLALRQWARTVRVWETSKVFVFFKEPILAVWGSRLPTRFLVWRFNGCTSRASKRSLRSLLHPWP